MSKLIELNERGEPRLTKFGVAVPEFKFLREKDHTPEKRYFESQINYIYFVYDKESPYSRIIPLRDRQNIVLSDKLSEWLLKDFEKKQEVFDAINKFIYLEFTVNERVLNRCKLKFGEFNELWSDTPVSHENYKALSKEFDEIHDSFTKLGRLEKIVKEEELEEVKNYGKYKPSLLELEQLD